MSHAVRSPLFFALGALAVLLVAMEAARPGYFTNDDNATWFEGAYAQDFRTLTQTGRLAEVNFYQYGGEPFLEQGQTGVLYPPVYFAAALSWLTSGDLRAMIEWLAAMHLALAVAGFYAWLRQGGVSAPLAALGGLTWALNPFVLIMGESWITVTYAGAWLPWLFWGVDGVFTRVSPNPAQGLGRLPLRALALGVIAGMFVLQGYVQWAAYAFLFAGIYGAFQIFVGGRRRIEVIAALGVAGLVAAAMTLPLLLPLLHAADESLMRAKPLPVFLELFYHVDPLELLKAQVGVFQPHFFFNGSTALFFCPALLLLPLAVIGFVGGDAQARRRLFPLLLLAVMALVLCGRGYFLLNVLPLMQRFRWPFKVFLFAEFFLIAALAWNVASWRGRRAVALLTGVLLLQVVLALARHDEERFSHFYLPTAVADLPPGMDPTRGRVIAVDDHIPTPINYRYFTHLYGTWFEVPSLGGYNPLASEARSEFAHLLDVPNLWVWPITPQMRTELESRAVRYWIVDPKAAGLVEAGPTTGLRLLEGKPDRLVFEDLKAQPIAFETSAPDVALPMHYAGNSMLIQLNGAAGIVAVSVGPTEGWWYRVDGAGWKQSGYSDFRLQVPVPAGSRKLEVSYFDPGLRKGARISLIIIILLAISAFIIPRYWRKSYWGR